MRTPQPTCRQRFVLPTVALALLAASPVAVAQVVTDPEEGGFDFQIQGEYLGRAATDEGDRVWGAQIIALGDGQFELVGYNGGLPGDGWERGDEMLKSRGERVDDTAVFIVEGGKVTAAADKLSVIRNGNVLIVLDKVERKSPTLDKEPPADAVVLFDGSSTEAWENGKLVAGRWLGATNAATKQTFGDHHLHIEFRTPFMPKARGQGRGNSGVYVQGRYEVQVLDSFGLEGKNNECGGIYTIRQPSVNMCLPPLAWQTYDIDFRAARYEGDEKIANARISVKHNGVLIHDDLELPHGTPGYRPEGPGKESLFLQDHGDPVVFRNIWVVEK